MRKKVFGRQFKRDRNERKALFKTLLNSLVMHESIMTSEAKAKAIKSDADKLITKAKKGGLHAYKLIEPDLPTEAVKKLIEMIAPRFATRQGGYTRIIRAGRRKKDNSQEVIIEWTEKAQSFQAIQVSGKDKKQKSDVKKESKKIEGKKEVKKAEAKKPVKEKKNTKGVSK